MPRRTKHPVVILALSPAALATAFGMSPRLIYSEIAAERLTVRQLPGSKARRISVAQAQHWFENYWVPAKPYTKRKAPHAL